MAGRHGGTDANDSRLVAARRHNAAQVRCATRLAPQVGEVALFHRYIKGIHVYMDDFTNHVADDYGNKGGQDYI